ncbi:MAG: hypothetical protein U5M23_13470 [Marinagarivorans sp.]|nr:hypothetical protein [Marinagarivorans sp.]
MSTFDDFDLTPLHAAVAKQNNIKIAAYFSRENLRQQWLNIILG